MPRRRRGHQPDMAGPLALLMVIVLGMAGVFALVLEAKAPHNPEQAKQATKKSHDALDDLPAIMAGSLSVP